MKIIQSNSNTKSAPSIVTMGAFDGVHLGHRKILNTVIEQGKELNLTPTLFTLWPHPKKVLSPETKLNLLNTLIEKTTLLKSIGMQQVYIQDFSTQFSELPAEKFIEDILVNRLNAKKIVIGYDHKFGHGRTGDVQLLREKGIQFGFEVEEIAEQQVEESTISSTNIRRLIKSGEISKANEMLSYNYCVEGEVIKGNQVGRTIGYPTANISIQDSDKLLPKLGAYVAKVWVGEQSYKSMLNLGYRPTVNADSLSFEAHLFDYQGDLYGKNIRVELLDHLRDETKFESIDQLVLQLDSDKEKALNYFS